MKITKYAHSCLLVEGKNKRILVDPGVYKYDSAWLMEDWTNVHVILLTHKHQDHCNVTALKYLTEKGAMIFSTKEVQDAYPELKIHIVTEGDVLNIPGGLKIIVTKAIHGYFPGMPITHLRENIGFIIDDGKKAYITGDTITFPNDYKCDAIFLPLNNHGVVMGPAEGAMFAKETGAHLVCPIHGDSDKFPTDWEKVKQELGKAGLNYKLLEVRESIEL